MIVAKLFFSFVNCNRWLTRPNDSFDFTQQAWRHRKKERKKRKEKMKEKKFSKNGFHTVRFLLVMSSLTFRFEKTLFSYFRFFFLLKGFKGVLTFLYILSKGFKGVLTFWYILSKGFKGVLTFWIYTHTGIFKGLTVQTQGSWNNFFLFLICLSVGQLSTHKAYRNKPAATKSTLPFAGLQHTCRLGFLFNLVFHIIILECLFVLK